MRASVGEDRVRRGAEVGAQCELVAHGAGQDEQAGRLREQGGHAGLERVGRRVGVQDVVEEGRGREGGEHGGRGRRGGVACAERLDGSRRRAGWSWASG